MFEYPDYYEVHDQEPVADDANLLMREDAPPAPLQPYAPRARMRHGPAWGQGFDGGRRV